MSEALLGGIEAGGTKFVCGVGRSPTEILRTRTIPTRGPDETLAEVLAFFADVSAQLGPISALGVASFGPVDLDPRSPAFGAIKTTPKAGWTGFNLKNTLAEGLGCPVAIDTDVTGSGLAEWAYGAGQGLDRLAYLTVGTGIGGALIADGRPLHRYSHPEMGHVSARRRADDIGFAGVCPFHGDCLEGLASGPAVVARYGKKLSEMPSDSPIWMILADYLAQLCLSIMLIAPPARIIIGGGVMSNPQLYPLIRQEILRQNNGYLDLLSDPAVVEAFVVPPGLKDEAGLIGALMMARDGR